MYLGLFICIGIALVCLAIIFFMRNQKDKKELEQLLNNDYKKTKDTEGDIETD